MATTSLSTMLNSKATVPVTTTKRGPKMGAKGPTTTILRASTRVVTVLLKRTFSVNQ